MSKLINTNSIIETKIKTKTKPDIIVETFNKYYPNKTIKDIQYQIIKSILAKEDVLAILPTGYGKSVCYQMPFLLAQNKIVLVISPLISLMEDQKDKLTKMNIPVACFHSGVNNKKKSEIKNDIIDNIDSDSINEGMVIFITPEYIIGCELWIKKLIKNNILSLVAFDEAHCISTWGHDFRPEYQSLYRIKDWIKESNANIPLLALTATATATVEKDIVQLIQLENHKLYKTSFDRPNLIINVRPKTKELDTLCDILNTYKEDLSIIYCKTRDKAEEISEYLIEHDYNADCYHAGLNTSKRNEIQQKFINKELNIIVATVAFGMGIDQNIHLVIHWGCPSDMESYYQEFGRAGRDGVVSECFLFYDKQDFKISRFLAKSITDTKYKTYRNEQITQMEKYCMLNQCRRKGILSHFGEKIESCTRCDNCINQSTSLTTINIIDQIMYPIYIIIHTVFTIRFKLGMTKIYLIVKGSKSKTICDLKNCKTYNILKDYTEDQIKSIINILILNNLLREKTISSGFGSVIETTTKVVNWYTMINRQIPDKDISFDALYNILIKSENKLELNIPIDYLKNLSLIKIKTISNQLIDEFNDVIDL